jgi:cob(I)alamin adenosyltransferase
MIQVYTGTGKGKTTAALGACLRAAGAGLRVYFGQFLKKGRYSEIEGLKKLPCVTVEQFGTGAFIRQKPGQNDREAARRGLSRAKRALKSGKYNVIILDEFNVALKLGLFTCVDAIAVLSCVKEDAELILTGRDADKTILKCADLISDIREVKHYYQKGAQARKGIEL